METKEALDSIYEYALEDIMGLRFGSYSKYIIQDRAIPDVRDGLKPVQRRILYGMYIGHHTYDKPYVKSARSVGDIMGKFHPHGDSSIYDAMVRMSQWWKQTTPYIDMHGNNGSMDGDSPAAMRYTEARLSKISNELLEDIYKNTVVWAPNFDDSEEEPTVLPARFPNLLVNGATGISAGYATNIPPHNLGEVIDATIKRIDSPNCTLDSLMTIVKGPDFPTGGIVEGLDGIKKAYETGKGRIIVKAKTRFEEAKGKTQIIIDEIPFEVNKAQLVKKIDDIRIDKKIDGIIEIRDESDREGLRIAIDLKKEANKELIMNYLLKNTEMQISYNFNVIAIVNRAPKQLGLREILDAYIDFQKEFITKRTQFDLDHAEERLSIVDGLIRCISILDEVIKVIRASKNRQDSKENLIKEFGFSNLQAEAIITLQLYRLSNTDITLLEEEGENLRKRIAELKKILSDENELKKVMKEELRAIKKEYAVPRKTEIKEEITDIKIDSKDMIPKEDVIVMCTKDGYVKRTSKRSYEASKDEELTLKEGDYPLGIYELNTLDTLLVFTSFGNYLNIPVYNIPVLSWKELGKHVSNLVKLEEGEEIISCIPITDFETDNYIVVATKKGMIKKTKIALFNSSRSTKSITAIKFKLDNDKAVGAFLLKKPYIFIATRSGYGLWFDASEIPEVGLKTSGVKGINLKSDDVVSVDNFGDETEYISVISEKGTGKRIRLTEFEKSGRAKRGLIILREVKSNPYKVLKCFAVPKNDLLGLKGTTVNYIKLTDLPIADRYSVGSNISKNKIYDAFLPVEIETKKDIDKNNEPIDKEIIEKKEEEQLCLDTGIEKEKIDTPKPVEKKKEEVSLKEIDDKLLTIEDFLTRD